ncbi:DUF3017 domain-containing protein [Streptomyces sp. NPDC004111]|uniref:DUF3017 domain-containing protein n=1 Tax=Streptomyces sp. NPDC004111 TaxID=3364690 RepID=UPI0036C598A2
MSGKADDRGGPRRGEVSGAKGSAGATAEPGTEPKPGTVAEAAALPASPPGPDPESEPGAESEPDPESGSGRQDGSRPAPGASSDPDPDPASAREPESQSEYEPKPKPKSKPKPEPESAPEPKSGPGTGPAAESESAARAAAAPEPAGSAAGADSASEAATGSETEPEPEPEPETETESEPVAPGAVSAPGPEGPVRSTRRFPLFTRDTARPEGGGRAAPGDAPAPARQWPLITVLGTTGLGLLVVAVDAFEIGFRLGTVLIGLALLTGAVLRWSLPSVGMLAVRSRFTDILTYGVLGLAITLLALMTQPRPWLTIPLLEDVVRFTVR